MSRLTNKIKQGFSMKYILLLMTLTIGLFAEFKTIGPDEFEKLKKEGVPVIDIRTASEWKETGIIEGSHKITFFNERGQPLLADWFFEVGHLVTDKKTPFIIYCAHASRSKSLGKGLIQMGFENVYELDGGIENGWIKKGKKTIKE
jgi:rhodanese-related sulfurtransferase